MQKNAGCMLSQYTRTFCHGSLVRYYLTSVLFSRTRRTRFILFLSFRNDDFLTVRQRYTLYLCGRSRTVELAAIAIRLHLFPNNGDNGDDGQNQLEQGAFEQEAQNCCHAQHNGRYCGTLIVLVGHVGNDVGEYQRDGQANQLPCNPPRMISHVGDDANPGHPTNGRANVAPCKPDEQPIQVAPDGKCSLQPTAVRVIPITVVGQPPFEGHLGVRRIAVRIQNLLVDMLHPFSEFHFLCPPRHCLRLYWQ